MRGKMPGKMPGTGAVRSPRRAPRLALAAAAGALALLPAAAAGAATDTPSGTASAAGAPTVFTIGILNDVDSFNPFTGILAEAYEAYQLNYASLMGNSAADFTPSPDLAQSWTSSPDGKTWTYKIRAGLKWSDGQPLTGKDVAYTYNRVINGEYEQTNWGNYVANVSGVTAPDDTTVVMTTKKPTPIMLHQILPILPEHVWSKVDEKKVKSFANEQGAVGSGPFLFAERKVGQFVRFTANPNYWRGKPKIDEVDFRVYKNSDAMVQALRKGEIDFADSVDADIWLSLKGAQGITQYPAKYTEFSELAFNTGAALADGTAIGDGHPALKDKRVRQALNYAIDRKTLVSKVLNGYGTEGDTIIPPIYTNQHLDPANKYTFDPAKANELLDAAGYKKGSDGVRTMPDGSKPLVFRLFGRTESQTSQRSAQFIKSWLRDVGITVNVKVVANDSLTEIIGQGNYDMFIWGWVVEPDPDYQLSTFTCGQRSSKDGGQIFAGLSDSFYCNPAFDALYVKQAGEVDPAQRIATVNQMQQMLYDDAPYAVIYIADDLEAYSSRFTGFVPQPTEKGVLLFQYGTWSYQNLRLATTSTQAGKSTGSGGGGGIPTATVVAVGAGAAIVAAGIGVMLGRRGRRGDLDVE
jgi:peptide/nickel transport system substrate-binding protein